MIIITKQSLINTVPERWYKAYGVDNIKNNFKLSDGKYSSDIYDELIKNLPLTQEKVAKIIGNDTWCRNTCCECYSDNDITIEIGDPDFGTHILCKECLLKAHQLIIDNKE